MLESRLPLAAELDPTFDTDGIAQSSLATADIAHDVAIQSDGKILVAATRGTGPTSDVSVVRYLTTGALDTSFGSGGTVTQSVGQDDFATAVLLDASQRVVVAGYYWTGSVYDAFVLRLTTAGALDATFGVGGIRTFNLGGSFDVVNDLDLQSTGNLVVGGSNGTHVAVARLDSSGTVLGVTTTTLGASSRATDVHVAPDNSIFATGWYDAGGTGQDFYALKYTSAGVLDPAFGSGGASIMAISSGSDFCFTMAVDASGRVVLGGTDNLGRWTLVRLTSTGSFDSTFGGSGIVTTDLAGSSDSIFDLTLQPDGKIVAVGNSDNGLGAVRYLDTGATDPSFGVGGVFTNPIPYSPEGVAVQSDGKIVIAGRYLNSGEHIAVARLFVSTTDVTRDGSSNLVVTDNDTAGKNDSLQISFSGSSYTIRDTTSPTPLPISLSAALKSAGATGSGTSVVAIPAAAFTGAIQVNTQGGSDTLTLDLSTGDAVPSAGIAFTGGNPTTGPGDKLVITGGSQGTVTYNYTNANSGSVVMSNFGTVTYTGLEPITNSGTATDVIFNLPAGPSVVTLGDDGSSGNGLSRLSSSPATFELTDFSNPTNSLTINRGNAADTLAVSALPDFNASLTLGGAATQFSTLTFNGGVTLAANKSLTGFATGIINLPNAASDLATSGTGAISLTTATNIFVSSGSVTTVNGNLTLSANRQASPTSGNFVGVSVNSGLVQVTGSGNLLVEGKGGNGSGSQAGVILSLGNIIGGVGGTVTVNGIGGPATVGNNHGIYLGDTSSSITSNGASVQVTGTGGGTGTAGTSIGVLFPSSGGLISAGGSGSVTVTGTGGSGSGATNRGVWVNTSSLGITSGGGNVQITGIEGAGASGNAIELTSATSVSTATNGGTITLIGNSMNIAAAAGVSAQAASSVTLRPFTNGVAVDLGSATDPLGGPLSLTDAELDRITAGTVQIGDANTGAITVSAALTHANHLSLTTGAGVAINNAVTMSANKNLSVTSLGTTPSGAITLPNTTSDVAATGTGTISLTTARTVIMQSGASVTTVNGFVTIEANQQLTPTSGNFIGVSLANAVIQATGTGAVNVAGKGGTDISGSQSGVRLQSGATITGGSSGLVTVQGTGGVADLGVNYGVIVTGSGSAITSTGSNVTVSGTGGGNAGSFANYGIAVANGGQIKAGSGGSVTVLGQGGVLATNGDNYGVYVNGASSMITSGGGAVSVTGNGGGFGSSTFNAGVTVQTAGQITAGGGGTVTVVGQGGAASGGSNFGVYLTGTNSLITSGGGNVQVTGVEGGGSSGTAFELTAATSISTATNGGALTLIGNSMNFNSTADISAQASSGITLRPFTNGVAVDLGSSTDPIGGPLSLSDAELDRVTAGVLKIGNANTGNITLSSTITAPAGWNTLSLQTGAGILDGNGVANNLTVANLAMQAVTGIGSADNIETTSSTAAAANTTSGNLGIRNTGNLTIPSTPIDGLTGVTKAGGGTVTLFAAGTLTINAPVNAGTGSFAVTASGDEQLLTVAATVTGGANSNFSADKMAVNAAVNVGTATLVLNNSSVGDAFDLGSATNAAVNTAELSDAELDQFTAGTLHVGNVSGGITVTSALTHNNNLLLISSLGNVTFNQAVTMTSGKNLSVTTAEPTKSISLATANADLAASGTGTINLTSARDITLVAGSSITTVNGVLSLTANLSSTGTGTFHGIDVNGATVQSTGAGAINLNGRGGTTGTAPQGVRISNGGDVIGGTSGGVSITGTGGTGTGGVADAAGNNAVAGVLITGSGSSVTSNGAGVNVSGVGGTATSSVAEAASGVLVYAGGLLSAGGTGTVTVNATGGTNNVGGSANSGVVVDGAGSQITSNNGAVSVTGTAGISVNGLNVGVSLGPNAVISAAGANRHLTVLGTGGTGTALGGNHGVIAAGAASSFRTTGSGSVDITGTAGGGGAAPSYGIAVANATASIAATGGGQITLGADSMLFSGAVSAAAASAVALVPWPNGTAVNLGAADSAGVLGLTDAELDFVTAGTIAVGGPNSGGITVSADITRSAATAISLSSSADIVLSGGQINTGGGTLFLASGASPAAVKATNSGVDVTASMLIFSGDHAFVLNGTTVDTQYTQLNVVGQVNLSGALTLSGTYAPFGLQSFVLINNDGADAIVGTFTGLAEGAVISNLFGSGRNAVLSYVGGDGNDAVLTIQPNTMWVNSLTPTATGARFTISKPVQVPNALNLYDYVDTGGLSVLGPSDVQLTNSLGAAINGSLSVDTAGTTFSFVATNGVLPPETYTLRLRSAANGFKSTVGELLDGDADGNIGGDYITTFQVLTPAAGTVTVSLPNIARGPEQPINVPADTALGLPISVSNGNQIAALTFVLRFDSGLLNVTGVTLPAGAPGGSSAVLTPQGAGQVQVSLTFGSPLSAGAQVVAYLTAAVPTSAAARYGERETLDLSAVQILNGLSQTIPSLDDDAVHANAYLGDLGRNGRYDSFDVQQASRLAVRLDTGFQQHPLLDPVIIGDFNGNNRIDSFDVQRVSRLAVRLPVTEAPALPSPTPTTTDTDRIVVDPPPEEKERSTPRADVDGNGAVDAQDVAWAIYYFNRSANGDLPAEADAKKLDVNDDQQFDAADVLLAITEMNAQPQAPGELDSLALLLAEDLAAAKKKK